MRLLSALAQQLRAAVPTAPKARVALDYEPAPLSTHATVASIQSALRAAEGGDTRQLFSYYRDLCAGGSHVQAEFNKRKLALLSQPHEILPADDRSREDQAAAEAIQTLINQCENWHDGLVHLMNSCLWPVSAAEKIYAPAPPGQGLQFILRRLEPVNPALLCFRSGRSNWSAIEPRPPTPAGLAVQDVWEPDLRFYATDEHGRVLTALDQTYPADKARHVIHRGHLLVGARDCWGGPMRAILFWWLLGELARDWFGRGMERYGSPFPVGHTDVTNPDALSLLQNAFALSTKIGGLVVDHATQIELKEIAATGMAGAYETFLGVIHREISKVIVGQTLSADAQPTGLGSSVGQLHGEVREDIRQWDQVKMGATLRAQVFAPFLQINGIAGAPPTIVWGGLSDADAKTFAELLDVLARSGFEPTDDAVPVINKRLGFTVQRKAPPEPALLPAPGGIGRFTADVPPAVRARLAAHAAQARLADSMGVPPGWLNPLTSFLEELQAKAADQGVSDQDLLQFLDQAVARVPELFAAMDVEELAKLLAAGMGDNVLQQVRRSMRQAK